MLQIEIPSAEYFNEATSEFVTIKGQKLNLEHSLISISKWESKWCKPFLSTENRTAEETLDYIKCMTISSNVDPGVYLGLTQKNIEEINAYIEAPMTATWFSDQNSSAKMGATKAGEVITSEIIYYWMFTYNIPIECEKWHITRLLTLIRVCNEKNNPPKKMSKSEIMKQNARLNAERRAKSNSKG